MTEFEDKNHAIEIGGRNCLIGIIFCKFEDNDLSMKLLYRNDTLRQRVKVKEAAKYERMRR